MRNLFDTLTNAVGQFSQQGNSGNGNNNNNKSSSALGQIGAMGVGGLLGALISNPKNISKTVKKAAYIGGGAALGGLAYSMYQKWRNQGTNQGQQPSTYQGQGYNQGGFGQGYGQGGYGSNTQQGYGGGFNPQHGGYNTQGQLPHPTHAGGFGKQIGYQAPAPAPFPQSQSGTPVSASSDPFATYNAQQSVVEPEVNSDAISDLLLEAMVFAARADNHIDANERDMIMKMARELNPTQDLMQRIQEFLNEPLDPNTIARKMPNQDMAPDLYRLSAAAIVADTPAERQYLQSLARALNLTPSQVAMLDREAMQFRQQQA